MQNFIFAEDWIVRILMVWARTSAIFLSAPFFSHTLFPLPLRILLSLAISYCLAGIVPVALPASLDGGTLASSLLTQMAIGVLIGFVAQLIFAGIQVAGQVVGMQAGFSLINIIDPQTQVQNSLISVFLSSLTLILFLSFNGHHVLIRALAGSFQLAQDPLTGPGTELWLSLVRHAGELFVIGLQMVAPLIAILIVTDILVSLSAKMAPQIPVLVMSFPVKILVGILGLSLCLYLLPNVLQHHFLGQMGWLEGQWSAAVSR